MKVLKYLLLTVIGFVLLLILSFYIWLYQISHNTIYCPLSHMLDDMSVCHTLDKRDGRTLVQHGSLNTDDYYLEIIEKGESSKFQFPGFVNDVGVDGYSAKLIDDEKGVVLINGEKFVLKKYTGTY